MKTKIGILTLVLLCSFTRLDSAFAQGTAFTYQGQLLTTNGPAHGLYDLTFALYNAGSGGSQFGSTVQTNGVFVTNGLFVVTVDFGAGLFNGTPYWLQLGVRTNGAVSFFPLSGRQALTPTPYAIYAESANATATLGGLPAADFWQLTGNIVSPGQFLGSVNSQPVVFDVNNTPELTLELNGSLAMGTSTASGSDSVALGYNSTASGGAYEVAIGYAAQATGNGSVAIGWVPISSGPGSVALGESVTSSGNDSFAAGYGSKASGQFGVAMGNNSMASGQSSWALGNYAAATNNGSFVWADDSTSSPFGDTAPNQFLLRASFVGINRTSPVTGADVFAVRSPTTSGYGGMYLDTAGAAGWPFYGYAQAGSAVAWTYIDGSDANKWKLNNGGNWLTVTTSGLVGINTTTPNGQLDIESPSTGNGLYILNGAPSGNGIFVQATNGTSAYGVWAIAPTGYGVVASSTSGTGVSAYSASGTGVYASSSSGSALTIGGGAIHVSGAGTNANTAAFIQVATAGNISGSVSFINNPICNNDPNAILIVTPNYNVGSGYWNHPLGVFYENSGVNAGKWSIVNEDGATMTTGPAFNVLIIKN